VAGALDGFLFSRSQPSRLLKRRAARLAFFGRRKNRLANGRTRLRIRWRNGARGWRASADGGKITYVNGSVKHVTPLYGQKSGR